MLFDSPGRVNTDKTIECAFKRASELEIDEVVVASSKGDTGFKVLEVFNGFKISIVTYHCGFTEPFESVMNEDIKKKLMNRGANVISATHALSGIERSFSKKYGGIYPALIVADTLRLLGQGTKVAVEIAIMAADAGVLSGKDIISIGGTSKGADTALIVKPCNQSDLFNLRVREVICKPRNF